MDLSPDYCYLLTYLCNFWRHLTDWLDWFNQEMGQTVRWKFEIPEVGDSCGAGGVPWSRFGGGGAGWPEAWPQ